VTIPVLVVHDPGCRYARESDGGHSDASKRLSDAYNLHRMCGTAAGWIAFKLADGSTEDTVYETRESAVAHQRHNEDRSGYVQLTAPHMSVCEAASVLRWHRETAKLARPDRDAKGGGLVVIPRLTADGIERQLAALHGGGVLALGRKR
jgi:hypothetical protein